MRHLLSIDDLTREEIEAGAAALHTRLERYMPRAVAYTGIGVYRWFRATSKAGADATTTGCGS